MYLIVIIIAKIYFSELKYKIMSLCDSFLVCVTYIRSKWDHPLFNIFTYMLLYPEGRPPTKDFERLFSLGGS